MNPGIKKLASGKAMRVATVFTGAAATAIAFTPMAAAATGHQARPDGKNMALPARHGTRAGRPDGTSGSLKLSWCDANRANWFHVRAVTDQYACWGFTGTWYASSPYTYFWMSAECGGNNIGWVESAKSTEVYGFGHGTTYRKIWGGKSRQINELQLDGWAGNDKCSGTT